MDLIQKEVAKDRLLRRSEAAHYIKDTYGIPCSPKTLAKLACISSDGPPFRLAGRFPLYPVSSLDEWAQRKIGPLVRSTSEAQTVAPSQAERFKLNRRCQQNKRTDVRVSARGPA
jgi:hypothetical protein